MIGLAAARIAQCTPPTGFQIAMVNRSIPQSQGDLGRAGGMPFERAATCRAGAVGERGRVMQTPPFSAQPGTDKSGFFDQPPTCVSILAVVDGYRPNLTKMASPGVLTSVDGLGTVVIHGTIAGSGNSVIGGWF